MEMEHNGASASEEEEEEEDLGLMGYAPLPAGDDGCDGNGWHALGDGDDDDGDDAEGYYGNGHSHSPNPNPIPNPNPNPNPNLNPDPNLNLNGNDGGAAPHHTSIADDLLAAMSADYMATLALERRRPHRGEEEANVRVGADAATEGDEEGKADADADADGGGDGDDGDADDGGEGGAQENDANASNGSAEAFAAFPLSTAPDDAVKSAMSGFELRYRPAWAERVSDASLADAAAAKANPKP